MGINAYLLFGFLFSLLVVFYLAAMLHRARQQLVLIKDALANQSRFIQQKQADQSYKRLMTSISHDVKTPLASLGGYLEAIESGMVLADSLQALRL